MRSLYTRPKLVSKIRRDKNTSYTADWKAISERIMQRDGYRCRDCGASRGLIYEGRPLRLNVHHIIPVSRGGSTSDFNLKTVCEVCHASKPGHSHLRRR